MEFRDLKKQYNILEKEITKAINPVFETAHYIMGAAVTELEEKLANYVGVKHCISCANGTDALVISLKVLGIKPGDAIFVPSFTFFSTAECVSVLGAEPIFVDVYEDTFNIDCEKLEIAIENVKKEGKYTPKAIIPVDLFGQPADYSKINKIAENNNLLIVEDAAQGFGGKINDKKACSFGALSTVSFFPAKPLGAYGDGGAIFTNNDEYATLAKSLRFHGKGNGKYDNIRIGYNSRLDTIQAAILNVKLKAFVDNELAAVNLVAEKYNKKLGDLVLVPKIQSSYYSSWAQYTLKLKNKEQRDGLKKHLEEKKIPSMIYYPKPLHKQEAYRGKTKFYCNLKISEKLCDIVLSLPMHPYLNDDDIDFVTKEITNYLDN